MSGTSSGTTVRPVIVVISDQVIEALDQLTEDRWNKMPESAQAAMQNMLTPNGWDFRMIVAGSLLTQIVAMATMPTE